jgi:DNA-binding protein HU-beta
MNRTDIRDAVARDAELTQTQADAALSAVLDAVAQALGQGEKVTIPGFGTFETRERSARTGRNPQTGEAIEIAASVAPAFKPASALKKLVSDR